MNKTKNQPIDKIYFASVILLAIGGFFIFSSASLGLLARDGATFQSVAITQSIGLIMGLSAFWIMSKIHYKVLKKYAFYIFLFSIGLNLLLFVPSLAISHGGASRWINLRFISFQPSEFLKIAFIIYFSLWLSNVKEKVTTLKYGILPYLAIIGFLSILLLVQKDTDTLIVIAGTGIIMLFISGAKIRHIALLFLIGFLFLGTVVIARPYVKDRVVTFFNPSVDLKGSGYQIQQSLIAIGSGQIAGRGYGQSVQKFNYLPEPIGDSIFAVQAEEFGFIGSIILVILYLLFAFRSLKISSNSPDSFGGLLAVGIAILIVVESFMNISSMLGLIPLSGMPLLFVSHGGTALMITLGAAGIIANISRFKKSTL